MSIKLTILSIPAQYSFPLKMFSRKYTKFCHSPTFLPPPSALKKHFATVTRTAHKSPRCAAVKTPLSIPNSPRPRAAYRGQSPRVPIFRKAGEYASRYRGRAPRAIFIRAFRAVRFSVTSIENNEIPGRRPSARGPRSRGSARTRNKAGDIFFRGRAHARHAAGGGASEKGRRATRPRRREISRGPPMTDLEFVIRGGRAASLIRAGARLCAGLARR